MVDSENNLDLNLFKREIEKCLPKYARPIFIRLVNEIELTGTFKMKKVLLQNEGFNPLKIKDPLYFLDASSNSFVPFTIDLYQQLLDGKLKLWMSK